MFYNDGNIFLTTYFEALDFIELFDLKFNSNSRFEILSIIDFLDDCLMYLCISLMVLKIL